MTTYLNFRKELLLIFEMATEFTVAQVYNNNNKTDWKEKINTNHFRNNGNSFNRNYKEKEKSAIKG